MSDRGSGWRALAVVLVLAGLPSASVRANAPVQDWYLGALDGRAAVLVEARKNQARLPQHDDVPGAAGARPGDEPDAVASHPALMLTTRSCRLVLSAAAVPAPRRVSLLPDCTGPPRA